MYTSCENELAASGRQPQRSCSALGRWLAVCRGAEERKYWNQFIRGRGRLYTVCGRTYGKYARTPKPSVAFFHRLTSAPVTAAVVVVSAPPWPAKALQFIIFQLLSRVDGQEMKPFSLSVKWISRTWPSVFSPPGCYISSCCVHSALRLMDKRGGRETWIMTLLIGNFNLNRLTVAPHRVQIDSTVTPATSRVCPIEFLRPAPWQK